MGGNQTARTVVRSDGKTGIETTIVGLRFAAFGGKEVWLAGRELQKSMRRRRDSESAETREIGMNKIEGTAKAWEKPELKRLDAGSAENQNVGRQDGGTAPGTAQS